MSASVIETRVRDFYEAHNPQKMAEMADILERWKGKEGLLLAALHKKYDVPFESSPQLQKDVDELVTNAGSSPEIGALQQRLIEFYQEYNPSLAQNIEHLNMIVRSYQGREDALFAALEYKYDVATAKNWSHAQQFTRALRMGADKGIIQRLSFELGVPDQDNLRPTVWRILLGYMPVRQNNEQLEIVRAKRDLYSQYVREFHSLLILSQEEELPLFTSISHIQQQQKQQQQDEVVKKTGAAHEVVTMEEANKPEEAGEGEKDGIRDENKDEAGEQAEELEKEQQEHEQQEHETDENETEEEAQERRVAALLAADREAAILREESLTPEERNDAELASDVKKDVDRTHPGLTFFQKASTKDALCRILLIYARLNPGVRYVQGMNELGSIKSLRAMLCTSEYLNFINRSFFRPEWQQHAEADTFFLFVQLMSEVRDHFISHLDSMSELGEQVGIRASLRRLDAMVARYDPELWCHLKQTDVQSEFYSLRWLTTLLSREFELPDTVQLWDSMLADPKRFHFVPCLCLTMLVQVRDELLGSDFSSIVQILQHYPPCDLRRLLQQARVYYEEELVAMKNSKLASEREQQWQQWQREKREEVRTTLRDASNKMEAMKSKMASAAASGLAQWRQQREELKIRREARLAQRQVEGQKASQQQEQERARTNTRFTTIKGAGTDILNNAISSGSSSMKSGWALSSFLSSRMAASSDESANAAQKLSRLDGSFEWDMNLSDETGKEES